MFRPLCFGEEGGGGERHRITQSHNVVIAPRPRRGSHSASDLKLKSPPSTLLRRQGGGGQQRQVAINP